MEEGKFIITDDNNRLYVNNNAKVIIRKSSYIAGTNTELPIEIIGDFSKIPTQYHKLYYDILVSEYYNNTDNCFYMVNEKKELPTKETSNFDKIVNILLNSINKTKWK